jgi:pimeloyl-ACP methyl ester carboxylesterase
LVEHTLGESGYVTLADGRKLHYRIAGSGGPTVVFEAGMGFSSATWGFVQPEIAKQTHTVVYDRAGAGGSDWDSADRTIDRICDDLNQLLMSLPGPFILVGYSWGGPIVRRVVLRRETDIRALVLIDPTDERNRKYSDLASRRAKLYKVLVLCIMHTRGLPKASWNVIRRMPADCRREIIFRDVLVRGAKLFLAEGKQFLPGLMHMRGSDGRMIGVDVTVVGGTDPAAMNSAFTIGMVKAQREAAESAESGRMVEARKSAHFTPFTEPELVVGEILMMVDRFRGRSTP